MIQCGKDKKIIMTDLQQQIININTPLISEAAKEERMYSIALAVFSLTGFILSFLWTLMLASTLFSLSLISILLLKRINILSIQSQCEINESVLSGNPPYKNTWQTISEVVNWISLGLGMIAIITFFIHS